MRHSGVRIAALTAAFALGGCGGNDDGPSTGDVSKQEYIAEADPICAKTDATVDAEAARFFGEELGLKGNQQPTRDQTTRFVEEVAVPEIESEVDDLRALDAPEGDADQLEAIYESLETLAENPETIAEGEDPFAEFNRMAQDYGFKVCGSN